MLSGGGGPVRRGAPTSARGDVDSSRSAVIGSAAPSSQRGSSSVALAGFSRATPSFAAPTASSRAATIASAESAAVPAVSARPSSRNLNSFVGGGGTVSYIGGASAVPATARGSSAVVSSARRTVLPGVVHRSQSSRSSAGAFGSGAGVDARPGTASSSGNISKVASGQGATIGGNSAAHSASNPGRPSGANASATLRATASHGMLVTSSSASMTSAYGGSGSGGGTAAASASQIARTFERRDRLVFTLDQLIVRTTVGTGTFGRVRTAQHSSTGQWFALKILKKSEIVRLQQTEHIRSEVDILRRICHPFIVNLLGHMQDSKRLYMLLEYVPGGELFSFLRRSVRLADAAARFYAAEVALAFEYLHGLGVIYRDLKPENLLLSAGGHVKIADFGFAKIVADRTYSLCGTPEYLAPEIIQSTGHSRGADWWAFGILIFEMLAGYPPFQGDSPSVMYARILEGTIEFPSYFDRDAKDLIRKLLTADLTRRLGSLHGGASDIKNHPWFKSVDWAKALASGLAPPYVPRIASGGDTSNFDSYPDSDEDTAQPLAAEHTKLFDIIDAL